ncbi:hypothetical protein [Paeniclostridium hominis]|uniref:hypothetical protein n=1 Tax=Paeniclostridium hominis TaxID=2764329 RepID=UPI0022E0B69C|nr:hypothetical protein [Paeniclostridium hominis]
MAERLFRKDINLKEDKLLVQRDISVYIDFDNYYSTHRVSKYRIEKGEFEGEEYFIFDYIDGRAIMNYTPKHYEELFKHITISDDQSIFQRLKYLDDSKEIYPVSASYRYDE